MRAHFREDGVLTVEDWLHADFASSLHVHLTQLPDEAWSILTFPSLDKASRTTTPLACGDREPVETYKRHANAAHARREFSFILNRLVEDHDAACSCANCTLRRNLALPEVAAFLRGVTGFEIASAKGVFTSWYDEGHFLSPHNDKTNGTLGFIYHLSKDWKREYGGILVLHDDNDIERIRETFVPVFNCVTIFNLTTPADHTHSVSRVVRRTPNKRLTVTGWWR